MINYGLTFHHLGLAVKRPDKAVYFLRGLGYEVGDVVSDEVQNVNLIMCNSADMPDVEIIFTTESDGPLSNILSVRDELMYHMCFESADVERSVNAIKEGKNRIFCISTPKPAVIFAGNMVSFYMVSGFGLIEILERRTL
jgi:methylmalonyl-CoA/ethylmalonyl-CoA epimerase